MVNLLAQSAPALPGLDLIGGSVLGVVLILLLFGWLWAKPAVDGLVKENDRLNGAIDRKDAELADLRRSFDEKVIPVIEKNTEMAQDVVRLLEERSVADARLVRVLDRLEESR